MSQFEKDLIESLGEAVAYARGDASTVRTTVLQVPDVKAIRESLDMSQSEFSQAYGIPLTTLQGWEQHRRHPDRTAAAYLSVIARLPQETRKALHP